MISAWTKHCKTDEEKKIFENAIAGSSLVIERLLELMKQDLEGITTRESGSRVYDLPNWDYRQADSNGYKRCLSEYMKLLNLDIKDPTNERNAVRPEHATTP